MRASEFVTEQDVAEGLDQDVPSVLYHATYKPRLKSIQLKGLGSGGRRNWEDSQRGVVYLALDPDVAESYAETSDMVPDEWLDQIVMLKISTAGLDPNKFGIDSNVQDNAGDTIEYYGVIPVSNISLYKQGVAEDRENFNGINLLLQKDDEELFVKASAGSRELGHVLFVIDGDYLMPQDLEVDERFRGQGIAQTMYDYVKSKGYKIRRSGQQTDAGAGFWNKHRAAQNVWEQDDSEGKSHDFMAGHCHVMALALKQLHPDWQIRAHVGWDDDAADDTEYRVDHVYTVAPDGTAYDCRGKFDNEQQLVGPDATGGVDTQYVNFGPEEIKQAMLRGELKRFTKQDLDNAMQTATQVGKD